MGDLSPSFIFLLACLLFLLLAVSVIGVKVLRPWLMARMAGVPIELPHVVGMMLRRTDIKSVLRALIMAAQANNPVPVHEMERAHLQGVDVEKVTRAYLQARKEDQPTSFRKCVEAELAKQPVGPQ